MSICLLISPTAPPSIIVWLVTSEGTTVSLVGSDGSEGITVSLVGTDGSEGISVSLVGSDGSEGTSGPIGTIGSYYINIS